MDNFGKDKTTKYSKTSRDFDFSDVLKTDAEISSRQKFSPKKDLEKTFVKDSGFTNQPNTTNPDDFNSQKFLYDTGLQNIFDDYEKNIASLAQKEQQDIADAYYIREMSKKYLGEYASNAGIGDVSGNLIDIYAAYQSNIGAISEKYNALEMGFEMKYQEEKSNMLKEQQNQALLDEAKDYSDITSSILTNIATGNIGDMNAFEYLATFRGQIDSQTYDSIYTQLYGNLTSEISSNLSSGYFGYKTDENGNRVLITDAQEYLEQYKDILSKRDYQAFLDMLQYGKDNSVESYSIFTPSTENNPNPYYEPNYDPSYYYNGDESLGKDVYFIGENSNYAYVQVASDVDNDDKAKYSVSNDELFESFEESNGKGSEPRTGEIHSYKGTYYVFGKDGSWYRLVEMEKTGGLQPSLENTLSQFASQIENNRQWEYGGFKYSANGSGADTLEYNGMKFQENAFSPDKFHINKDPSKLTDVQKEVLEAIKKYYGDGGMENIGKFGVVFAAGRFWCINQMYDICPMDRAK